ncbi:ferric anguibactin-binding protein [Pseudoalteromonas ruthenica]|uniref:Ferric anguibactin-binding protein n=1 Tax=Pseudoalteromonas ruthenica TaxID=151081 RepID=A0A5S3ZAN6_9GAMM|nr:siderophore ABC transporter substrate-binding protein [Pseudoalteromonas ruthenica]TMP88696.1 ferric anguibactin-binding protein [Pseudoalteromonas ruthenica]
MKTAFMKNFFQLFLSFLTVVALSTTMVSAKEIAIKHLKGTAKFNGVPKRVVVLGNASLDILDRLGIKPVGAPHSLLPNYLANYEHSTQNTGTTAEPDFEAIFSLKPDVIIAENRMLKIYDDIKQIAPTIMFYIDSGNYWQDAQKNWRMLGKLFDKEAEIERLINQVQVKIDKLGKQITEQQLNALMIMNNGNNLAMFNKGSRFSLIFDEFNFAQSTSENIAPIKGNHGSLISFEYIADAKPDVMFVMDREQAIGRSSGKAQALFNNPLVNGTPAAKNSRLIFIDSNAWYISTGGITATELMVADAEKALL